MTWTERQIASALCWQTFARKCIVLVDRCNWTGHECDVLAVTTDCRIIDVEVKISRADLKADRRKAKWWIRLAGEVVREQRPDRHSGQLRDVRRYRHGILHREHPPKVWKHYYAMPESIWVDELADSLGSPASGVLLLSGSPDRLIVRCQRRARPARDADRLTPAEVAEVARLANLRMWNAYDELERRNGGNGP